MHHTPLTHHTTPSVCCAPQCNEPLQRSARQRTRTDLLCRLPCPLLDGLDQRRLCGTLGAVGHPLERLLDASLPTHQASDCSEPGLCHGEEGARREEEGSVLVTHVPPSVIAKVATHECARTAPTAAVGDVADLVGNPPGSSQESGWSSVRVLSISAPEIANLVRMINGLKKTH